VCRVFSRRSSARNLSAPLEQAENRDFARRASPAFAFADAAEVALVDLHFAVEGLSELLFLVSAMSVRSLVKNSAAVLRCTPTGSAADRAVAPATKSLSSSPCCRGESLLNFRDVTPS
jgi:hypothetical protein